MEDKKCSICNSDKNVITHHLSYEPEITSPICTRCHLLMHRLAKMSKEQQGIVISWIKQYGEQWENGNEKYMKSEHYKKIMNEYRRSNERKNCQKQYYEKNKKTENFKNNRKISHNKWMETKGKKYQKEYKKKYQQTDKHKKYQRDYYLKHLTSEKALKYIEKMGKAKWVAYA